MQCLFSWQRVFGAVALLSMIALAGNAHAQSYPIRGVKIVVPWTPGGSNDVLGRVIAQKLSESWGQPVVVENRPGAGGNLGADAVAKSAPDGYTLLVAANNILSINPTMNVGTPFDPIKDFVPITLIGAIPVLLAVNPSVPAKSVKELIVLAKSKPDGLSFGSSGLGSPQQLSAQLFASMAGIKMQHVPYKGATPLVTDLVSGQNPARIWCDQLDAGIGQERQAACARRGDEQAAVLPPGRAYDLGRVAGISDRHLGRIRRVRRERRRRSSLRSRTKSTASSRCRACAKSSRLKALNRRRARPKNLPRL